MFAALAWLRRRGPQLPESLLRKLFQQETVRMFDPATGQVRRTTRGKPLPAGARILIPKAVLPPQHEGAAVAGEGARSHVQQRAHAVWMGRLRQALLHSDADLLAINKPAGNTCPDLAWLAWHELAWPYLALAAQHTAAGPANRLEPRACLWVVPRHHLTSGACTDTC